LIRQTTRPPTGQCTLPMYMGFLMSEPKSTTCTRLSEVMKISHDSANRFLLREAYEPRDLFNEAAKLLNLEGGTLSVDDTVLDKPYSQKMDLVGYFWSGKHHRAVKGINLITLYYTDPQGRHLPVNYRVIDKVENKTKNEYFQEMLAEVLAWGLRPVFVTADSWYACEKNLKTVKHHGMGFVFAVESNRTVSIEKGTWVQVHKLDIPEEGLLVWLRDFGQVKLFRTRLKDQLRHYVAYLSDQEAYAAFEADDFQTLHDQHWQIEQYHRLLKQVCNIERFQVRSKLAIGNHIFASLCSFIQLQHMRMDQLIANAYQWRRELYADVVADFIRSFTTTVDYLNPQFRNTVNA
jgi:DDE family transposase